MRVIGLTGGIASGKSTVARLLSDRGAVLVDADAAARSVVAPGEPALAEISARFGDAVVGPDGRLDRAALGAIVFADPAARQELEAITHPRIRDYMARQIAEATSGDAPLVVVDIPLLYESGRDAEFSEVMVVYAGPDAQRERLAARDGLDPAAISQRLAAQQPIEEKRRRATWVIDNSGTPEMTADQVDAWWRSNIG